MNVFNPAECEKTPRADMFLPDYLKYFGFFLDLVAVIFLAAAVATQNGSLLIGTLISGVIIWPVSEVMDIIGNYLSRRHEYQADAFAAKEGYGPDLISALKRLNKESLAGINPHPAMVVLSYSHPTLSQRIEAIEKEG